MEWGGAGRVPEKTYPIVIPNGAGGIGRGGGGQRLLVLYVVGGIGLVREGGARRRRFDAVKRKKKWLNRLVFKTMIFSIVCSTI